MSELEEADHATPAQPRRRLRKSLGNETEEVSETPQVSGEKETQKQDNTSFYGSLADSYFSNWMNMRQGKEVPLEMPSKKRTYL